MFLRDFLMRQAEKLLIDARISHRNRLITKVRKSCPLSRPIEEKEEFVDRRIEKDIKWFLTDRQFETHNKINM